MNTLNNITLIAEYLSSKTDEEGYDVGYIEDICGYRIDFSIVVSRDN